MAPPQKLDQLDDGGPRVGPEVAPGLHSSDPLEVPRGIAVGLLLSVPLWITLIVLAFRLRP